MPKKPKRGRPPKEASERRRKLVSVRFRDKTRAKLEELAEQSGRPLSQEIEYRVEQSFEREELASEILEAKYGPQIAGLLILMGDTMRSTWVASLSSPDRKADFSEFIDRLRDSRRYNLADAGAYDEAVIAVHKLMSQLRSADHDEPNPLGSPGNYAASSTLEWLRRGKHAYALLGDEDDPHAALIRRLLGPLFPSLQAAELPDPKKKR